MVMPMHVLKSAEQHGILIQSVDYNSRLVSLVSKYNNKLYRVVPLQMVLNIDEDKLGLYFNFVNEYFWIRLFSMLEIPRK